VKHNISSKDLQNTSALLEQLSQEVGALRGNLSSGKKLDMDDVALQGLRETQVSFGNPNDSLIRLTEELFADIGLELSPVHKQQMQNRYNFYYMTLAISMQPGRGTQFTRVECRLDFGPKGEREPIVQSIFPNSQWKEMLNVGIDAKVGLDGNLNWNVGVDPALQKALPANIGGQVANVNEFKAVVTFPTYSMTLGKTEIAAMGEGNSQCFWRIEKPDLQKAQTVPFGVVFKVPKGVSTVDLQALAVAEPDFRWLTSNLSDVYDRLSNSFKTLLSRKASERHGQERLLVGDHEEWTLKLPMK